MLNYRDSKNLIDYWKKSSTKDFKTAESLYQLRRYDMCLFFCHLSLEKLLKAVVVKETKDHPPYIHDLNRLAIRAGLKLSEEQMINFDEITKFNVQARYDDVKLAFYKKATKEFSKKYLQITKEIIIWLKKEFLKK